MNIESKPKQYIIKKIRNINPELKKNYKEIFEEPNNYFYINENVIIGIIYTSRKKVKESPDPNFMKTNLLYLIRSLELLLSL